MKLSLYTKVRLFFHKEQEPFLRFLYSLLGFFPCNISLYRLAFRHRSSPSQSDDEDDRLRINNNERLEFLGDAVLDAIVADIVYQYFPDRKEGFLTNTRSKIVQREMMNRVAIQLKINRFLSVIPNASGHSNNIYGNALEALIGAIYLDKGYECCKQFVEKKIINSHLDLSRIARKEINFKSVLIEWGQKNKIAVAFNLVESIINAENNSVFQTEAIVGGRVAGIGIGTTKKESQQNAAKIAVSKIRKDKEFKEFISILRMQQKEKFSEETSPENLPELLEVV
ncbi:MAG: ribonuclease III [Bacteroidales bacterium]|nr:ribonuclease III [Bacteroidales bacterium]